jgi:hypothetical protein
MALSVPHVLMIIASIIVVTVFAAILFTGGIIAAMVLLVRPWDGNTKR